MFCSKCGAKIEDDSVFCSVCGQPQQAQPQQPVLMQPQQPVQMQPQYQQPVQQIPPQQQYQQPVQQISQVPPQYQQAVPQNAAPKKKKTLMIILIAAGAFMTLLVAVAVTAFFLLRNRDQATDTKQEHIAEETEKEEKPKSKKKVEKAEPEIESEEDSEPVPTPAPAIPYAEEQGFTFTDPYTNDFSLPTYSNIYYKDEDGRILDAVPADDAESVSSDASYHFQNIVRTEPDDNGNVRIFIPYHASYLDTLVEKNAKSSYEVGINWRLFRLYDYYTGIQIPIPDDSNLTYETEPAYTELEWEGNKVRIGIDSYMTSHETGFIDAGKSEDGFSKFEDTTDINIYYCVTAPADYDGLMLVGYKEGSTEAIQKATPSGDGSGTLVLGPDVYNQTYTKDDLIFIRVSENIKDTIPNDFITEHNIRILQNGDTVYAEAMKIKSEKDTEESYYLPTTCCVSESIEDCEPGMKKVTGSYTIDYSAEGSGVAFEVWVDAFDRYTGTSFMSGNALTLNAKKKTTELEAPITIDTPDGPKEIFMETESKMDKKNKVMNRSITITCPVDYDGTVFMVGYSSRALAEKLDFEAMAAKKTPIDQLPFYQSRKPYYFYSLNGY